jgi:hypothetical protein
MVNVDRHSRAGFKHHSVESVRFGSVLYEARSFNLQVPLVAVSLVVQVRNVIQNLFLLCLLLVCQVPIVQSALFRSTS